MKGILKNLLIITLVAITYNRIGNPINKFISEEKQPTVDTYTVTATMYYPVKGQCDSDPLLTAGMYRITPGKASEQNWIAMSRNMLTRWGGKFNYGDLVKIEGAGHKNGVYRVVDTMNKRFKNRIDFLEDKGTKLYKFENVKLALWNTQTPTENHLASL